MAFQFINSKINLMYAAANTLSGSILKGQSKTSNALSLNLVYVFPLALWLLAMMRMWASFSVSKVDRAHFATLPWFSARVLDYTI